MSRPKLPQPPNRFVFIASLGNPPPYERSRHSAGHILLRALDPILHDRLSPISRPGIIANARNLEYRTASPFCKTWRSPALMNQSGTKLLRRLVKWIESTKQDVKWKLEPPIAKRYEVLHPTLCLLHDELEAPLGQVVVKLGGEEEASVKGHRGLKSVMDGLRANRMQWLHQGTENMGPLAIMRVGVGIGRPESRDSKDVADYVLEKMHQKEREVVEGAAGQVLELVMHEFYRTKTPERI